MSTLFTLPKAQGFDRNGDVLPGAKLYFFANKSSTPQAVYVDADLNTPHAQPVEADAFGVWPIIWYADDLLYRVTLEDADGLERWTEDDMGGPVLTAEAVGAALYPITDDESGMGLTEDDLTLQYPPGYVLRYGVMLDGSDDTAALQACADFCFATGTPIRGAAGTAVTSSTIVLKCTGDLSMMLISCPSSTVSPAVRVGVTSSGPTRLRGHLKLPRVENSTKPGTGWAGQQVGIELAEVYEADIYVPYVWGFDVDLDCGGYTSGCSYNTVRLGLLGQARVPLRVGGKAVTGWANQNTFIGGRLFISSAEGTGIVGSRYVQLTPWDASSLISGSISAATNAGSVEFTTSANHGWSNGQVLAFTGFTDTNWTAFNGNSYAITVTASNKFTVAVNTTTFGAYTSGASVSRSATDWPNGNTFIGMTLESGQPEYLLELAGSFNQFVNCRYEANPANVLLTGHSVTTKTFENLICGGYNAATLAFTKNGVCLYNHIISGRTSSMGGSGVCWNVKNESSSAYPIIQGFPAGATDQHLNATYTSSSQWQFRLAADALEGKAQGDSSYRVKIEFNTGKMHMTQLQNYANDGAAATGGIAVGQFYRNGSVLMVRVT